MANNFANLNASIAKLDADVQTLIAKPPVDVQPAIDAAQAAVDAIDANVVAATTPSTP